MNRLASIFYEGSIWQFNHFNITSAYHWYNHDQKFLFDTGQIDQKFRNTNYNLNIDNKLTLSNLDIQFAYQYEKGELEFDDHRNIAMRQNIGIESALFKRNEHGIASILKFHVPTNSTFLKLADLDLSYRYDYIDNDQENLKLHPDIQSPMINFNPENAGNEDWSESTFKFSSHLLAESRYLRINSYLNFGSNVKFPTLFQQISSPTSIGLYTQASEPDLSPEKNRSLEIGNSVIQEINDYGSLNGWQLDFNFFKNYYDNKFRTYYSPGIATAFYDNVQNADISGLESTVKLFLAKRKITFDMGASKYFISEKAAFPFKSDLKYVINFYIDHAGYSFRAHGFYENEQTAWIRNNQNQLWEVALPGYSNLDLHINKTIELIRLKVFLNLSVRNLFDNDAILEGIAIRDRRYYFTFGIQY
jgi:outer membrane receptor for ferrienterochelin and colicin